MERVKQLLCIFYIPSNLNLTSLTSLVVVIIPLAGDIAFRFLEYVRFQQERQKRRAARSMQAPSWQDISNNYSTEEEDGAQESRAVVCDINKEMLRVGKQKADGLGVSAGELHSDELKTCDFSLRCETQLFGITFSQYMYRS